MSHASPGLAPLSRRAFLVGGVASLASVRARGAQTIPYGVPRVSLPDVSTAQPAGSLSAAWTTLLTTTPLLTVAPDGRISGGLAMSWLLNADRNRIELRIRPDALFADGTRVLAADVVASAALARETWAHTPDTWRWECIDAVEEEPDNVVRLTLREPDEAIPALLASHLIPIWPAAWIAAGWDRERGPYPPACGSFQLQTVSPALLRFTRNPAYFQVGRPRLSGVACVPPSETLLRTTDLVTNGVDLLIDAPLLDVPLLRQDPQIELVGGPTNRLGLLAVNLQSPIMADVRLRRLLDRAIDRDALVATAAASEATPASALIPADHWAGLEYASETIGPDEVRSQLAELGHPPGVELRLVAGAADASLANACVLLQEQLAWAGVALSLDLLDVPEMEATMAGGRWDLAMRYTDHWRDPHELVRPLVVSDGTRNAGGYVNSRVDYLAGLAGRASDNVYRAGFYQTIQRIVASEVPVIPLFFPNYYDAMTARIGNYPFYPPVSANALRQATMTRPDPIALP